MPKLRLVAVAAALVLAVASPAAARSRPDPVKRTLDALAAKGSLPADLHAQYSADWSNANRAARRLRGSAGANLNGVLATVRDLAQRRLLDTRLAPVFLTLERNYEWFWTDRNGPAAFGARTTFDGSPVIFEFYPGAGWQIQVLGNFGKLNGLAASRRTKRAVLTAYADALLPLAVQRHGFLAFEYYFPWSGGRPGWISGMATATGIAALARVWQRTGDARYRDAGESMLGAFFTPPPWGVKLDQGPGRSHYLQYSQDPNLLVGNAFAQSLIGLDDFATITGSQRAQEALQRGLAQADAELSRFDTGAWSLYWRRPHSRQGGESDLHYHQLFESFLVKLCARFPVGPFCRMQSDFARYQTEPVQITSLRAGRRGPVLRVSVWTSKRGSGRLSLLRGSRTLSSVALALSRGNHRFTLPAPRRRGSYDVRLDATSLNGIKSSTDYTLTLR